MNEIANKFLLVAEKFMPEMYLLIVLMLYLPEPKKELKNLCRLEIHILFRETNLIKLTFNMIYITYGKSKDLAKRTQSDKVLRDKAFKIANDAKYDGYQRGLTSMVTIFLIKKYSGIGVAAIEPSYQLANELHRQIIIQCKRQKVYSSFRDDIWGIDLADMQSLSKYNKGTKYLLCAIDIFSKYGWVVPLKG